MVAAAPCVRHVGVELLAVLLAVEALVGQVEVHAEHRGLICPAAYEALHIEERLPRALVGHTKHERVLAFLLLQ